MSRTPEIIDRREMLALSLATAIAAALPKVGFAAGMSEANAASPLASLLAGFAREILRLVPETATGLGVDQGEYRGLRTQLDDASDAGTARWKAQIQSMLARLAVISPAALSPADRIHFESVRYATTNASEGTKYFYSGRTCGFDGSTAPYVVSQQNGALTRVPEFLNTQHQINNQADAEAYLERVRALARVLDQESVKIAEHASRGAIPPNFIAANALGVRERFRRTPASAQPLVASLVSRTKSAGITLT